MTIPIVLLSGEAGSGKDTVALELGRVADVQSLAYADPMKRAVQKIFEVQPEVLWGASELRKQPIPTTVDFHGLYRQRLSQMFDDWFEQVLPGENHAQGLNSLTHWLADQLTDKQPLTVRKALQTIGTEWGRANYGDVWISCAHRTARELLLGGKFYERGHGVFPSTAVPKYPGPEIVVVTDGRMRNEVAAAHADGFLCVRVVDPAAPSGLGKDPAGGVPGHASEKQLADLPRHFFHVVLENDKCLGMEVLRRKVVALRRKVMAEPVTL